MSCAEMSSSAQSVASGRSEGTISRASLTDSRITVCPWLRDGHVPLERRPLCLAAIIMKPRLVSSGAAANPAGGAPRKAPADAVRWRITRPPYCGAYNAAERPVL